jgi:hypothetical protein
VSGEPIRRCHGDGGWAYGFAENKVEIEISVNQPKELIQMGRI